MDKDQIIEALETIAHLLEIKGENAFKVRAYINAVRVLETAPLSAQDFSDPEKLESLEGIGKAIAEKVATLASTGKLPLLDELKAGFPPEILTLFTLQGLGAKKVKALYEKLGVGSIPDLEAACNDGRVAGLAGFGQKSAANFLKSIAQRAAGEGLFRIGSIAPMAEEFLAEVKEVPGVLDAKIAGSYRRRKEIVRDLDFLVSTREPQPVSEFFTTHHLVTDVLAHGATKSSVLWQNGMQCDLRAVSPEEFPFALNYFTGSKEHNVRMRGLCLDRGWSLNEYRFSRAEDRPLLKPIPEVREEEDIYRALDLQYVEPELREDLGELAAAASHSLPKLVELSNLRGVLHNHTNASDGRNSLREMVEAAADLGLEYLGIADHSKSSFQANGLDEIRLRSQIREIADLNASKEFPITVLSGTECDILKDGSLDFPDELLASLDYVVASVHSSFTQIEADMTRRMIRAMENPYVTILGHPTGRLLLEREPYPVDIPAILDAAAATGTIIELNANPSRLDLDWRWWPLAKEKGVRCAISPDAHSTAGFQYLVYGVGCARKGWLTREDIVNCLNLEELRKALVSKRSKSGIG